MSDRTPMRLVASLLCFVCGGVASAQTTWYVSAGGSAPGSGTQADPFTRIDYALGQPALMAGDIVLVSPGDYPLEQIDFGGKDVRVEATAGPGMTAIVGHGEVAGTADPLPLVTFANGEGPGAVLAGFTLRGTDRVSAPLAAPVKIDGAFPTLENCVFSDLAGGDAGDLAGALVATNGGLLARDCRFDGVSAAVYSDFSVLRFEGTTFEDCERFALFGFSSGVELADCEVLGCGSGIGTNGSGAIVSLDTNLSIVDCLFDGAPNGFAGPRHIDAQMGSCSLRGSTFTRGHTFGNEDEGNGGCVFMDTGSLLVEDCEFMNNGADDGGSIFALSSSVEVSSSVFEGSRGAFYKEGKGGAVWCSGDLSLNQVTFRGCSATGGGALQVAGAGTTATLVDCVFEDNVASWEFFFLPDGRGGAIEAGGIASLVIEQCVFSENRATDTFTTFSGSGGRGGAIYSETAASITGCRFEGNAVESDWAAQGGALFATAPCVLEQCVFVGNRTVGAKGGVGASVYNAPPTGLVFLRRCTIDNGAELVEATVRSNLVGCIVVGSTTLGSESTASESLIEGGWSGAGNLDGDPLFWGQGDYHLRPGSPVVDGAPSLGYIDPDGSLADMGALPFDMSYCTAGCAGDVGVSTCASTVNSTGQIATAAALGSAAVAADFLVLVASDLPPGQFGYFLVSTTSGFEPNFGGGLGNLCLGGIPVRLNGMPNGAILVSNQVGDVSLALELQSDVPGGVSQGDSVHFQYWFRDMAGAQSTSNTSSDVVVSFL